MSSISEKQENQPSFTWMTHKYELVKNQVSIGLKSVRLLQKYIRHALPIPQIPNVEKILTGLNAVCEKDNCQTFSKTPNTICMISANIHKAEQQLAMQVNEYVIKSLKEFTVQNEKRVKQIDDDYQTLKKELKNSETGLEKLKQQCLKQLECLKEMISLGNADPKVVKKREKTQNICNKKFALYEKDYSTYRGLRSAFYSNELPKKLKELEAIERLRLNALESNIVTYMKLVDQCVKKIASLQKEGIQWHGKLNKKEDFSNCVTNWIAQFGQAPEISDVPFGLPCRSKDILQKKFDTIEANTILTELIIHKEVQGQSEMKRRYLRSKTVSKLLKKKQPTTKTRNQQSKSVDFVSKSPQSQDIAFEITSEMTMEDFFSLIEKKFGFKLHELIPHFESVYISTVGDLLEDPDWVNQVQMDQKYVQVIKHCLQKAQAKAKSKQTTPIIDTSTSSKSRSSKTLNYDEPVSPTVFLNETKEVVSALKLNKKSDPSEVEAWLTANNFDPALFKGKNGDQFFNATKTDLKKIYGQATGVRLYNRREDLKKQQ